MNKSQKILVALFFLSSIGMANHGRYEQYWSDYEDFANNRGKFKIGQKGVIVYKKEGLGEAATIEQPIPNFDGMVDGGAYALWGDPQILSTASHVGNWGSFTFIQRHLRKDVELSEGFKNKANTNKDSIVQEYSERVKMPYMRDLGNDYSIGRLKTIAFDGYTPETIKNRRQIHYGDLVARTGGGINSYAHDGGEKYPVGYGNIAGGLNKIYLVDGGSFWIKMQKNFQTPLDSASRPGDSGSPVYIWDKDNNKWLLAGENSAGSGDNNWNKISIIKQNPDLVNKYMDSIEDEKITDANVTLEGKTLGFGNSTRVIDDNAATAKNQTFAKNGLTLTVNSDSDTGASRFRFSENANITGTGKFNTAGLIIDKNVNVNYNIISDKNTVIRKRGEGSLTLNANSKNDVEVNIGEGSLILDNSNGYAASHIRVAQGAKVILNKDNQLNDNKIYFGHRGGTLELKGQNLEFNDIYHLDKDAIIANKESTTKSKFTFTQGKDRVFLGKFSGNMDVEYNPNEVNENSKWNLRGNTDITGDLNVKKGIVSISGDVITSGYENNVLENQFEKTTFKAGNINVDNGSTLQLDRATKVDSNINVSGKLDLTATGEVLTKLDKTKPYKDYEDQSEVNKVNVNGNITFKNGVSNNFNATVENNNLVEINSKMSGTINGEKTGNGLLKINNSNNDFSGNLTIKNGAVESENENILSNGKYKIEEKGLLRVNNNSNFNVLDKIDKSSTGVISLGNSLAELDKKYSDYTNLYIGSKNDITIGANDKAIDKSISNINLGGDNGTVTLKGLELEDGTTVRNINAGNDKHRGNVVIDGLSNDAKVNITIRDGINFVVNNNRSNSQFLDLGYGATAGTSLKNNLKDSSIGVLELTNENSIEVKKVAIGAKKDSNVILNSYTTTNDKTRFSGEGNLTYTSTLENKELEVDAQNLSGGVVTLTGDNKAFTNKVTVMGNKNGVNNGSITLKLGSEMLKHKNEVLIKDGGILDINNNDVSIKLNNASNKYGTLTNSGTNKVDVTLDSNEATTINTTLTGNLNIIKKGTGTLKFDNKNNFKGNVVMNGGELIYDKDVLENDIELNDAVTINKRRLLSGKEITTEKHAITKLTISTNKSNGDIKSSFGMINIKENANININSITVLKGHDDEFDVYKHLNLYGVSRDKGSLNIGKVTIADGAKMYVRNQRMIMQSLDAKDNSILTLERASLKLVYSENTILNSGLKELGLTRSKLYLRDYSSKISDKNSDKLTKVVINASREAGDSEIINGESLADNGGGGGATFVNPIVLKSDNNTASLIFKSGGFFGSGTGLTINAKVSGEGVIKFERNNGAKFEIQDNFKEFNGKVMSNNQPNVNYDYNISSDNAEDRVIGYNLTGVGSYTNKSNKDLTFTNLSGFTGKLVAQNGDIVLKDDKAIDNTGKVETYNNTNITLLSNNNIEVTSINLENKNTSEGNTNKVIKDGSGRLSLGDNTSIVNFKTFEVKYGELELKKNIEVSNIDLKDSTKLDLNFITNGTITSKIIGTGDLIKVGTTKIDIEGSKLNNTGSIDLQAGELSVTGDKVLSNKVKGSADLTFKNSNVEVKDIENFSGNLNLENSTLTLKEDKSLNTDTKIIAKESSNIKLDLSSDKVLNKLNVENKGLDTNKIEKLGEAKLTLGEDLNIKNFKHLDVKAGTLEISKNIPIENVNVDTNTKLNVNNTTDIEMDSNIKGAGDIVKLGTGKLSIASNKLNSEGSIDLQAGELSVTGDKVLSNKVKGSADLTFKNSNVEVKDIENFSGNLNLENSTLTLKEDKSLNTDTKIIAKESSNIKLDLSSDKVLNKLNVENKGLDTNKIEKLGEAKLTLGEDLNIKNFKHLDVKAGTLEISKNIPIENVNVDTNTKLNVNNTTDIEMDSNIKGAGDIVKLGTGKLSIASSKLNSEGNIDLQVGELSVTGDKVLSNKVKGSADLTFKNSNVEVKDIENFSGNLNLENSTLTLKEDKSLNTDTKIIAKESSNIKLDLSSDKVLNKLNVENKGLDTNKIEKLGEAKLTLGEDLNIKNFKHLDVKAGTLEISKNIPIENVNVDTNTKLNVNNTTDIEMDSNIKGAGDIVKLGAGKLSIASSKLNSEGNIDLQAGELSVTGDKVLSNKVKGSADLTFKNSNVEVKDIENFSGNLNLENSTLTLKEDKSLNTDTKIIAKESSNIKLDLSSDKVLNKLNVENKGLDTNKIEKLGEAKLTLGEDLNIKNFKHLDVKAGTLEISKNIPIENVNVDTNTKLNVNNTTDIEMDSNIKGAGDIVKLGAGKLSIASSKLNNLGDIEISNGKVEVNLEAEKVFSNKLKGNGNLDVIASNSNKVEFKELKEFTGNINGRDIDVTLNGDNSLNSTVNLSGTSKLNIINDNNYSNLSVNIENGKTVINSDNKIDATINVKEKSSLIINKYTNINKVNNEGTVVLENSKLHLDGYNSDKGIVDINLKNKVEGILDIKNSEKDVNVKVNMSNEVIEELKNTQLLLASSNKNVNILNLDDINKNLVRKLMFKSENNNYYIYSMLKSRDLSYSNIVNNLDSIYRNVYKMNYGKFIEARYTHQAIVDNKEKVFENSKYTTENNTDELGINGSYYIDKLNLGINLEYIHSRNSLSMKVVDGGSSNTNYSIHSLIAKTGYKKGIFDISARVGVSNISILYSEPENIKSVMNGLAIGINPEYRFNKNTLVKYVNEFGYENISLSGKYITKAKLFNMYYKTGLSLNHKYIDLDLLADLRRVDNNTSTNKDVEIDVKNKYVEVNTLLKLTAKPTDSLRLNAEVELKFNQNKFAKYILNSGIQFRW